MIILRLVPLAATLPHLRRGCLARDPARLVRGLDGSMRKAARRGAPANTVVLWLGITLVFAPPLAGCNTVGGLTRDTANSTRSEEHTSELQSLRHLVCRLLLEKKK